MDDQVQFRDDGQVRALLRSHLGAMGLEIARECEKESNWGYWVRFGDYPVLIDHRAENRFCVVAFQITLKEEPAIEHLNRFYDANDAQFIYELSRAFCSPVTSFSRILENGRVIGFSVSKNIYPYHHDFSIRHLDSALQAVVSTGAVGISFLRWMVKVIEVRHQKGEDLVDRDPCKLFE